jgi:alpha-L-fucosidase 2
MKDNNTSQVKIYPRFGFESEKWQKMPKFRPGEIKLIHRMKYKFIFLIVLLVLYGCPNPKKEISTMSSVIWYDKPAENWLEALPLGNGRLGAMVFGGVKRERLQLNEESLWAGEPVDAYPENFYENLQVLREMVLKGKISEARQFGIECMTKKPASFRSYEPLADMWIRMMEEGDVENYYRDLTLNTGIARVGYEINGVGYKREGLISAVDDVIALRISASEKKMISCEITLSREKDMKLVKGSDNSLLIKGQIVDIEAPDAYDDNPGGSGPGGKHMKFTGLLKVKATGGTISMTDTSVIINGADEAVILFTAATDYNIEKLNFDRSVDPDEIVNGIINSAESKSWNNLVEDHIKEHRSLFDKVEIDLGGEDIDSIPVDQRLARIKEGGDDPALASLYFQYGRYLLMSSSRKPGVLPANLQGVWNDRMWAPWESDYHLNINLQMNYWPVDVCNLPGVMDPLSEWMVKMAERGELGADTLYHADGWMLFTSTNPFGRSSPAGSTFPSQFMNGVLDPLAGAWMAISLFRHYEFTMDREYLGEIAYPMLKGASEFLLDYLVEDDNGSLIIIPSTSPENNYLHPLSGESVRISKASTYHMTIVREVFESTIKGMEILSVDEGLKNRLASALKRIPGIRVGGDGTIMEWIEDFEEAEPGHRHMSHLMGLHPFGQITESSPELFAAAARTLERRLEYGGGHTGWSRAWIVNFYSRLFDAEEAHRHLLLLFKESTNYNLFDNHPPFQIDGNFGGTAGIAEMLVQSHNGYIHILPALPEAWPAGKIKGLCARGNFVMDIKWNDGKLTGLEVFSGSGGPCKIRYGDQYREIDTRAGNKYKVAF